MNRVCLVAREGGRPLRVLLLACLATLAASAGPSAQESGTVTGSVTDAQGLALPGAAVVLRTAEREFVASTVTDRTGAFVFDGVAAGDYRLAAGLLGFARRPRCCHSCSRRGPRPGSRPRRSEACPAARLVQSVRAPADRRARAPRPRPNGDGVLMRARISDDPGFG